MYAVRVRHTKQVEWYSKLEGATVMRIIQVNPCIEAEDGISRCETPEADFFGIYLSEFDPDGPEGCAGCYEWVADLNNIDHARHFARALAETHGYTLEDNT